QDRRPLLPRVSVVLERRRALRLRPAHLAGGDGGLGGWAVCARLRTAQVPLSVARVALPTLVARLRRALGTDHALCDLDAARDAGAFAMGEPRLPRVLLRRVVLASGDRPSMSQESPDRLRRAHQLFVEAYRL